MFYCTRAVVVAVGLTLGVGTVAPLAAQQSIPAKARPDAVRKLRQEDIDLWSFSVVNELAPGKTLADFRALPNLAGESKDELRGTVEDNSPLAAQPWTGPISYRLRYSDGLELRVLDYGQSAFVTRLRINAPGRVVKDEVKIGGPRAQIEAVLGQPTRGGLSYSVYEGRNDVVRVFYTPEGTIKSVEIDRGG